ncbi:MAG: sugar porter family MFS transporter [Sedimentisphaerales bacterium]|nr:sugar porter family MFS transporter [Sedimentisphaerales bacterium]
MESKTIIHYRYLLPVTLTAALGGLLFGYDTAVISGCIDYMEEFFHLSVAMKGWAASSALVGCIVGALAAGFISDAIGRKRTLLCCSLLFAISAVGSAIPRTLTQLAIARIIGGVAVGAASMTVPMYIAELAPEKIRGRLVSLYQLAVVVGISVVFFVNMLIQRQGGHDWNVVSGWRWMFGSETLPAVLFGVLLLGVPESPRWLMSKNRLVQAQTVLQRIMNRDRAREVEREIQATLQYEKGDFREVFAPEFRPALIIGVCLALFQQFSGINAVMYYAPSIFRAGGADEQSAFMQAVVIGAVNLIFTGVAIWLVDRRGRKALLLIGALVQTAALGGIGILYYYQGPRILLLACILIYVAAFSMALGPVVWIMIAEIFPNKVRGRAMMVATFVLWGSCYVVSQTFPMLIGSPRIGIAKTFWIYSAVSLLTLIFVWRFVPETKGRTLEEIEAGWLKRSLPASQKTTL